LVVGLDQVIACGLAVSKRKKERIIIRAYKKEKPSENFGIQVLAGTWDDCG